MKHNIVIIIPYIVLQKVGVLRNADLFRFLIIGSRHLVVSF